MQQSTNQKWDITMDVEKRAMLKNIKKQNRDPTANYKKTQ
jgi:hypothetical protein